MALLKPVQCFRHLGYVVTLLLYVSGVNCDLTGYDTRITSLYYLKSVPHRHVHSDQFELDLGRHFPSFKNSRMTSSISAPLSQLRHRRDSPRRCRKPRLRNGKVRPRRPKTEVYFKCKGKYQLVGSKYATCKGGKWSPPPPVCVKSGCRLPDMDHTPLIARYFYDKAVVSFACPSGYELRGPRSIFCDGTMWNSVPPFCLELEKQSPLITEGELVTKIQSTVTNPWITTAILSSLRTSATASTQSTPSTTAIGASSRTTVTSTQWTTALPSTPSESATVPSTLRTTATPSTPGITTSVASTPRTGSLTSTLWTTTALRTPSTAMTASTPSTAIVASTPKTTISTARITHTNHAMLGTLESSTSSTVDITISAFLETTPKLEHDEMASRGDGKRSSDWQTSAFPERASSPMNENLDGTSIPSSGTDPEGSTVASYQSDGYTRAHKSDVTPYMDRINERDTRKYLGRTASTLTRMIQKNDVTHHVTSSTPADRKEHSSLAVTTVRTSLSESFGSGGGGINKQTATVAGLISGIVLVAIVIISVIIVFARWLHNQNALDLVEDEFVSVPYPGGEAARNDELVGTKV